MTATGIKVVSIVQMFKLYTHFRITKEWFYETNLKHCNFWVKMEKSEVAGFFVF